VKPSVFHDPRSDEDLANELAVTRALFQQQLDTLVRSLAIQHRFFQTVGSISDEIQKRSILKTEKQIRDILSVIGARKLERMING
jgi:hypothetical protein